MKKNQISNTKRMMAYSPFTNLKNEHPMLACAGPQFPFEKMKNETRRAQFCCYIAHWGVRSFGGGDTGFITVLSAHQALLSLPKTCGRGSGFRYD